MKKYLIIAACVIVGVALAALVYYAVSAPRLNFTYYTPTYLPPGVSIAKRTLFIQNYQSGGDPFGKTVTDKSVTLSFRDVDNVYSIHERSATQYQDIISERIQTSDSNFDASSIKPTCRQMTTSKKISYRLCHWIDYDRYSVYEMNFVRDDTWISVQMNTTKDQPFKLSDLNSFIDSFQPGNTRELTVKTIQGGG